MYKVIPVSGDFPAIGPFAEWAEAYVEACEYLPQGYEFDIEEV